MRAPPAPAAGRRGTRFHSYGFVTVFRQFFGESGEIFCYTDLAERTSAKKRNAAQFTAVAHTRLFRDPSQKSLPADFCIARRKIRVRACSVGIARRRLKQEKEHSL